VVRFCAGPCSTSRSSPGIRRPVPALDLPVRKRCERWLSGIAKGRTRARLFFERTVERQEAAAGPIGAPREAYAYRGEVAGTVSVSTGGGEGDCGFDFETGSQYLVYADKVDNASLVTSICSGTSLLAHADSALRVLPGEQPTQDDLLDGETYHKKFGPLWTGTGCGRVTKADGTPFGQAWVDMTQVRNEPFAVNPAADSDQSKADGSFCIRYVRPGKYLLTAERLDVKDYIRWAAYYPGVAKRARPGRSKSMPRRRYPTCSSALAKCVSTRSCCPWRSSAYRSTRRSAMRWHTI
jgi:hypothetical protein